MKNPIFGILALALLSGALFAFSGSSGSSGGSSGGSGDGSIVERARTASNSGSGGNGGSDQAVSGTGEMREDARSSMTGIRNNRPLGKSEKREETKGGRKALMSTSNRMWKNYLEERKDGINESRLECANEGTMMERAKCRISLPKSEQKEGLYYLPEECRNQSGDARKECLVKYDAVQPCRFMDGDGRRFECVREKLAVNKSAKEIVEDCKEEARSTINGTNATDQNRTRGIGKCVSDARSRMLDEIKFRLYNLQEKAERLKSYGASDAAVAAFMVKMDELKAKFGAAGTNEGRKAVLKEAEAAWKEFYAKAVAEIKEARKAKNAGGNAAAPYGNAS